MSAWATTTLGDVGEPIIGLTYSPTQIAADGTLVLRSSNIQNGQLTFDDVVRVNTPIPDKLRCRVGDILICVRNGSRSLIGKSLYLDERVEGESFGAFMSIFRSELNSYLRFFFQSESFKRQVDEHLGATINQITNKSLSGFKVTFPDHESERNAIVASLNDVSNLISSLTRLITKKCDIRKGMMQELLTGRTRLPGFEAAWTDSTVGLLSRVVGGGTPSTRVPTYWGGGIPWFTPAEIDREGSGLVSASERTITSEGLANSSSNLLPEGSVLVTSRASIGKCAVADVPAATNQGFAAMIPNDLRSTWFLYFWTLQNRFELESRSAGSTFLEISASKVASVPLRHPELDEQYAIGKVLRDADSEIDALELRLKKSRAIKQGMMQELLTGRTRLSPDGLAA
jgi:type I restriction enzyme S subunit